MASNPMTRATIIDNINNIIGATLTATWTDAKINSLIDNTLSEVSDVVPFVMVDIYQLETRRGAATSTSSNNLVDATNSQFLTGDVGKAIYNTTDKTWAEIQSYSSETTVGLSADIMASGEGYEIYNKGCWNHRQINIGDSGDFLWVIGAVYPASPNLISSTHNMREVKLLSQNKIAEIDVAWIENTKNTSANKDVQLYLARQHVLNVATDFAGAATAAGTAGDKTLAVDVLGDSETYYKNSLFYFTLIDAIVMDSRLTYRLTADVTMSSGAGTLSFFPGLECNTTDNDTIAFIKSTLSPELERILIDIVTGELLMAEGISQVDATPRGGSNVDTTTFNMGRTILEKARLQLKALVDVDLRANKVLAR